LNSVKPEVIAFKYLWKKLNKGGIIIFDDYAQPDIHTKQKKKLDSICKKLNIEILSLPTGNGLLIK
jgi:O-methyltransferase